MKNECTRCGRELAAEVRAFENTTEDLCNECALEELLALRRGFGWSSASRARVPMLGWPPVE
jgi:hypothetical protein